MTRRYALAVALVTAQVGLVAACGGGGSSDRPISTVTPTRSAAASPPAVSLPTPTATRATVVPPSRTQRPPASQPAVVTVPPTQTTTPPAPAATPATQAASSEESTPWGWIIAGIAIVLAVAAVIALVVHRRRQQHWLRWRQETRGAIEGARLVQQLLPGSGLNITDPDHWTSVRERVEQAATALDAAVGTAPRPEAADAARAGAQSLRNVAFALESARLLQGAAPPPSPEQLAEADTTTRARQADLDGALSRLESLAPPPNAQPGEPQPPQ